MTTAQITERRYTTVPKIARRLGVNQHKVLGWIHSGRLRALNVSEGHQRPRYKVDEIDLELFLGTLAVNAAPAQAPRRRRAPPTDVIEFFR